jgi:hypothetical protein
MARHRIFLLSPANPAGKRAAILLSPRAEFDLARRLRQGEATLGEAFAFISGLYFRGKLAYAAAFSSPPAGLPGALVITAERGLLPPDTVVTAAQLMEIASVPIDVFETRYRAPLERDCGTLLEHTGGDCEFVLLGSVATPKYVQPISAVLGDRLLFPQEFIGRGDLSRGGLMLRSARAGLPLTHVPLGPVTRHGSRPPRLAPVEPGVQGDSPRRWKRGEEK